MVDTLWIAQFGSFSVKNPMHTDLFDPSCEYGIPFCVGEEAAKYSDFGPGIVYVIGKVAPVVHVTESQCLVFEMH
jgi:hypothetical protein